MYKIGSAMWKCSLLIYGIGVGIFVFSWILYESSVTIQGDGPSYAGRYEVSLRAIFDWQGEVNGQAYFSRFTLRGRAPERIYLARPKNVEYNKLQFEWTHSSDGSSEGQGIIRLPDLEYQANFETGILTKKTLEKWLLPEWDDNNERIEKIYSLIVQAAIGEAPRPQHHPHYFHQNELDFFGRLSHHALGASIVPTWLIVLTCIWTVAVATASLVVSGSSYLFGRSIEQEGRR